MPARPNKENGILWSVAGVLIFLLGWVLAAQYYHSNFILPGPLVVIRELPQFIRQGNISHIWVTAAEAGLGFTIGLLTAVPLGTALAHKRWLERLVSPYIIGAQAIPILALAPLLVLWFGYGLWSKILVAAMVSFFPILMNIVAGFKQIDPRWTELMSIMGANPWQRWRRLDIPAALPFIFAGLRVGLTLSIIGAVVGEFAGAERGLGFLVNYARGLFDTPLMFLALVLLACMGICCYLLLALLERLVIPWRNAGRLASSERPIEP